MNPLSRIKINGRFGRTALFPLIIVAYFVLGLLLLNLYRYHINTDVPTYVAIAQKYAAGHFHEAVNSFWSPLISWLMVPFLLAGTDPLVAFKAVGLLAGVFALLALKGLLRDFSVPEGDARWVLLGLIPAFYAFTLITMNPDFLLAVILLFYVRKVISADYGQKRVDGLVCGLLGAAAYFAKGFAFPFFIAHFTVINLCRYLATGEAAGRKRIRTSLAIGLATFALFSAPWIGLISAKYGALTFNNAGSYNFMLVRHNGVNPIDSMGLTPPSDPMAVSFWDGLDLLSSLPSLEEKAMTGMTRTLAIAVRNLVQTVDIYQAGSLFSAAIVLMALLSLMGLSGRKIFGHKTFLLLVTMALYTAGYLPLLVIKRYFYLNILLLFVLGVPLLCRHDFGGPRRKQVALVFLCLSFMFMPVRDLYANRSVGRDLYRVSQLLGEMGVGGRIASNGRLDESLFASYHLGAKFYGMARAGIGDGELLEELKRYRISYYFCWQEKPKHWLLSRYPEISLGRLPGLRVYKVTDHYR